MPEIVVSWVANWHVTIVAGPPQHRSWSIDHWASAATRCRPRPELWVSRLPEDFLKTPWRLPECLWRLLYAEFLMNSNGIEHWWTIPRNIHLSISVNVSCVSYCNSCFKGISTTEQGIETTRLVLSRGKSVSSRLENNRSAKHETSPGSSAVDASNFIQPRPCPQWPWPSKTWWP